MKVGFEQLRAFIHGHDDSWAPIILAEMLGWWDGLGELEHYAWSMGADAMERMIRKSVNTNDPVLRLENGLPLAAGLSECSRHPYVIANCARSVRSRQTEWPLLVPMRPGACGRLGRAWAEWTHAEALKILGTQEYTPQAPWYTPRFNQILIEQRQSAERERWERCVEWSCDLILACWGEYIDEGAEWARWDEEHVSEEGFQRIVGIQRDLIERSNRMHLELYIREALEVAREAFERKRAADAHQQPV